MVFCIITLAKGLMREAAINHPLKTASALAVGRSKAFGTNVLPLSSNSFAAVLEWFDQNVKSRAKVSGKKVSLVGERNLLCK